MTLQQMRYVLEVVRNRSLRKAATTLFVTEANISKQIRALESELGIRIFNRMGNNSVLTEDGQRIIQYFNEVLENVDFIKENFSVEFKARQKFAVSSQHYTFAAKAFGKLMNEFTEEIYQLSLFYEQTIDVLKSVSAGKSEIGVVLVNCEKAHSFERLFKSYCLEFHSVFQTKARVFLSAQHPLAKNKSLTAKDLEPYPCILYTQDELSPDFLMEEVIHFKKLPPKIILLNDLNASLELLLNAQAYDIGTGLLMDSAVGIIHSAVLEEGPDIQIGWLAQTGKKLSPLAEKYIELLEKSIMQMDKNTK
ncbi:MAG: LysR family transcriptional regulator [Candidatus Metalachnospira sp.]|nr:LysR family transcriptional regulator [Candidatus Metalachnospira sp.]